MKTNDNIPNSPGECLEKTLANFGIKIEDRMTPYLWELMARNFLGMLVDAGILHTSDGRAGQEGTE